MGAHLTMGQRAMVRRMRAEGRTLKEIGAAMSCSLSTARMVIRDEYKRPAKPDGEATGPGRLTLIERETIMAGVACGETFTAIADRLGRVTSTVSREVSDNGGRGHYVAWQAHQRAHQRARRPKVPKLACSRLAGQVTEWLQEWWSPQEISRRLRLEFPDDPMMQLSHETIYQALFVQGRGELRRELHRCLRSGRAERRPRGRAETRGRIPGKVMISERPAEAEDRAVLGHWEGDLIIGKNGKSAVGTLVERATRYVLLLHLPDGRSAEQVELAMRTAIGTLPGELFRTITWDQGVEMARHATFTIATGIPVYFCDPHSPWQRGTNENTNGLLRQYMPKGTDLSVHSAEDLARFARSLNNRPRATLDYMKPSEKLTELLAHTA
jgi:IS30 family transposase